MKKVKLGDYFKWNGFVVKCEWINHGDKAIGFNTPSICVCEKCGHENKTILPICAIEKSPHFQQTAESIPTITDEKTKP